MLDLISDIGGSEVIVESAEVILDLLFGVASGFFGLLLHEPLVDVGHFEWLDVSAELLELE